MGKKKKTWKPGDNFLVPLQDGTYSQGQVLSYEGSALNSALCAFSSNRYDHVPEKLDKLSEDKVIAALFVTRDQLDSGRWLILGNGPTILWEKFVDLQRLRAQGFVGVTVEGSLIVETFLSAYHKLVPWNCFHDPKLFDGFLISRVDQI